LNSAYKRPINATSELRLRNAGVVLRFTARPEATNGAVVDVSHATFEGSGLPVHQLDVTRAIRAVSLRSEGR
jgi:hypothetical protein